IEKRRDLRPAGMYRFSLEKSDVPVMMERVATLPIRSPVTAADISPDGKRLLVLSVTGPTVFQIDNKPEAVAEAKAQSIFHVDATMEAAAFDGEDVLATTERGQVLRFPFAPAG